MWILTYLFSAIRVKHVHNHLLLILAILQWQCLFESSLRTSFLVFLSIQVLVDSSGLIVLQEDSDPAGVSLNLHPQDAVSRPAVPDRLQTVDGGAGEGDVYVGKDEEDKERLTEKR